MRPFRGGAASPPRRLFQRGARSLQWQGEDRDADTLEYSVYYRSVNETTFRLLKEHMRENYFTVDGASLSDGRYLFRVVASDALDNPQGLALSGERTSEPVDIDNSPPTVRVATAPQIAGIGRAWFLKSRTAPDGSNAWTSASMVVPGGKSFPTMASLTVAERPIPSICP